MHAMINGKMYPEYKAKWLEALRSGAFKQGDGQLCTRKGEYLSDTEVAKQDHFCCLGVLNEILKLGCADDEGMLVLERSGGEREKLLILDKNIQEHLIYMNDRKRMTFTQIADWIEERL